MKRFLHFISDKYLSRRLDFRVRLFNVLAMAGMATCLFASVTVIINKESLLSLAANFIGLPISFILMEYARRTGRYQRCYTLTVLFVFFLIFPMIFFFGGGYHGAMPSFFIFAVLFTIFMLDGKKALIIAALELIAYIGMCVYAYYNPESVTALATDFAVMTDTVTGFSLASVVLGVCMYMHFKLYNEQQRQLDEQNRQLSEINRMKTEFFASVSHEMKTPLTVVSVHIQRAEALMALNRAGDAEKIQESFALAQDEIMRMSRMVDSALKLSSIQELGGQHTTLDISELLHTTAEAYRTLLEKQGNTLMLDISDPPLPVQGSADNLVHLLSNLLSNAGAHTQNGEIRMTAASDGKTVTLTIADNGEGISPELLSRVFERGVSGSGGSGLGLPIAKEIAEAHSGSITIASEPGVGTTVTVTLPAYKEETAYA